MADITRNAADLPVVIIGATTAGIPNTPVGATPNGDQYSSDTIHTSSQYRAQSVTTSAAEATGAASRLTNRKVLCITPTNGTIYWGTSSGVTTITGTPLLAFQTLTLSFTDAVPVYVIAAGTVDARILEGS